MSTVSIFHHDECQRHDMGPHHPESPARLAAIIRRLDAEGILGEVEQREPISASYREVLRAHPEKHIEGLQQLAPTQGEALVDPDTLMMPRTLPAAWIAAGAAVQAVDTVMQNPGGRAFCATRPPGHHAQRERAMGFCFFNNVAIAALHALEHHGLERVAIVDFDVHQGNGTIDVFEDDPRVLVCSSFQHPLYPFSHVKVDRENIVNTPLPAGTRSRAFRNQVETAWLHRLQDHRPQLLLISAGFDAHERDPLGGLALQDEDFLWVTSLLTDVARVHCNGRMVSVLEGGYDLDALAASVSCHIQALLAD